ncbi:MAG: hypothetical protein AB8F78_01480 [Saprospiraceae bacterium]
MKQKNSIATSFFIALMVIHAVVEIGVGLAGLINFQVALEQGFKIQYTPDLEILGLVIGLQLLLLGALSILSILWTRQKKSAGPVVGLFVASYILIFGLMAFFRFGEVQALYIDSLRGSLTVIFGFLAYKELKNIETNG